MIGVAPRYLRKSPALYLRILQACSQQDTTFAVLSRVPAKDSVSIMDEIANVTRGRVCYLTASIH